VGAGREKVRSVREAALRKVLGSLVVAVAFGLGPIGAAEAHHSFAVFFEAEGSVSATGVVTEFNFRNPHASITIEATDENGETVIWRGETNSPSLLQRRGWTRTSLALGESITMEGWPSRDGSRYMRIRTVRRADGSLVGDAPLTASEEN
jgi:hypothetical protein